MAPRARPTAPPDPYRAYLEEEKRRSAQTFPLDHLVRLHEDAGTKAQRAIVWRVVALPDPAAKRKADREHYGIEPVTGGAKIRAGAELLDPLTAAEAARYATVKPAQRLVVGTVVVPTTNNIIRGADMFTRLVVIDEKADGTVKLARLGGDDGRYWTGIPVGLLQKIEV